MTRPHPVEGKAARHKMRRRYPESRYWDCDNCGDFLFDTKERARKRVSPDIAARVLGKCVRRVSAEELARSLAERRSR